MTDSMRAAISLTERRRMLQIEYNKERGIEPTTVMKTSPTSSAVCGPSRCRAGK